MSICTLEKQRQYGAIEKEHKRDVKTPEEKTYTGVRKNDSLMDVHPSAITDHATKKNHAIDWEVMNFRSPLH